MSCAAQLDESLSFIAPHDATRASRPVLLGRYKPQVADLEKAAPTTKDAHVAAGHDDDDDASTSGSCTPVSRSRASSYGSEDAGAVEHWRTARTPSPEMSYSALTGRSLPPPRLLLEMMVPALGCEEWPAPCGSRPESDEGSELPLASMGSEGHRSGTCRPCAHVWKPSGCSKGRDCEYCHECGREEFLKRKSESRRKAALKAKLKKRDGSFCGAYGGGEALPCGGGSAGPAPCRAAQGSASAAIVAALSASLPSAGSAGHAHGTCRPCAHAWRPAGCCKGLACTFCHLCGESDFKAFRSLGKAEKERWTRVGAGRA